MLKPRIWASREFASSFSFRRDWIWYVQRPGDHGPQTFSTFNACLVFLRMVSREPINVSSLGAMRIPFQVVAFA